MQFNLKDDSRLSFQAGNETGNGNRESERVDCLQTSPMTCDHLKGWFVD